MTRSSSHARRTVGDALNDPNTGLGRAVSELETARKRRLAVARALVKAEGLTLEEAFARIWKVS